MAEPLFCRSEMEEIVDEAERPVIDEMGLFGKRGKVGRAEMEAYVKRWHKIAQIEQVKFGIPASISLAQGILESASGTSRICGDGKNHFGMKCFKKGHTVKNRHKGICINAHDDKPTDYFRTFATDWESWRGHSKFLKETKRYSRLFSYGNDYKKWAVGLKKCGYATSKKYDVHLIELIEDLNLQRFDKDL